MRRAGCGFLLWLVLAVAAAQPPAPVIAVVLDDLGNSLQQGEQALALPGQLTFAFLPQTPYAAHLSRQAHASSRESMVHLPMQALTPVPLGPGGLTATMVSSELEQALMNNLASVPFAVGVNNHMGSYLTQDMRAMSQLMELLRKQGNLYFMDSRTHDLTVAEQAARHAGLPVTRRDVFLDNQCDEVAIDQQFQLLLRKARRQGSAVAVAHPYPETLRVLARRLPELDAMGVELVSLSRIIERQNAEKATTDLQNQSIVSINSMDRYNGYKGEH